MASVAFLDSIAVMYHGNLCRRINTALKAVTLAPSRNLQQNLVGIEQMKKELKAAVKREQKQFDRLQFPHKKAQSNACL